MRDRVLNLCGFFDTPETMSERKGDWVNVLLSLVYVDCDGFIHNVLGCRPNLRF